jgi:hypothetical protein
MFKAIIVLVGFGILFVLGTAMAFVILQALADLGGI